MDNTELRRALLDLRSALDDADAVTRDMLRPRRSRDLGPRLHAKNYREAYGKMDEVISYLLHSTNTPPEAGGSSQPH